MAKYLDLSGLRTLWDKAKNTFALKTHKHIDMDQITDGTGDSDVTDDTDFVTSYADDGGYTQSHPKSYRRKAPKLWNYIKGKLSSDSNVNISGNAESVRDYERPSDTIKIGWRGSALSSASSLAAYGLVNGQRVIKDISVDNVTVNKSKCVQDKSGNGDIYFDWNGSGCLNVTPEGGNTFSNSKWIAAMYTDSNNKITTGFVEAGNVTTGNSNKWGGWKIKFGTPTVSDVDTICFF